MLKIKSCETCPLRNRMAAETQDSQKLENELVESGTSRSHAKAATKAVADISNGIEDGVEECPGYKPIDVYIGFLAMHMGIHDKSGEEFACQNPFIQGGEALDYLALRTYITEEALD